MTQVFVVSRLFGAMALAAAIDAGCFGPKDCKRILLISHDVRIPELSPPPDQDPGFTTLATRFDEVVSLNDVLEPMLPQHWQPRPLERPMFERLLRAWWGLGSAPVELVVTAIQSASSRALTAIFHDASITVYSDGLMAYGPTRSTPPVGVSSRISRLLYLDLVPGLVPYQLTEYVVAGEIIPEEAFRKVLEEVGAAVGPVMERHGSFPDNAALIVGQYLADLGILTPGEEEELHLEMIRGVVARGHSTVLFKPHPANPPRVLERLRTEASALGARLEVIPEPVPAEAWVAAVRPALVVGCFSTALNTAARYFDTQVAKLGTIRLLGRLTPYENSNRVPATITDATLPRLTADGRLLDPLIGPEEIERRLLPMLDAVSYCMQPGIRADLRGAAFSYLEELRPGPIQRRYFRPGRLTELGLPGAEAGEERTALHRRLRRFARSRLRMLRLSGHRLLSKSG